MTTEESPLLEQKALGVPPILLTRGLSPGSSNHGSTRLPQTIAHRGYKAAFPENTLSAFTAAVDIGAHAIETDLHLSKDKVVVLSHDATLERCFGEKAKIADCDWSYLSTVETVKEPRAHMPRLVDLLSYLAQPEVEDIWVLLDLKKDDDPDELLSGAAEAIAAIKPTKPWKERIVLGAWDACYIELCKEYLPGFHIAFIGWSVLAASKFLKQPDINFNMLQPVLVGPCGSRFMAKAKKANRHLYVWTVNEEEWMEWSIRKEVDGVITDDPKLFLDVCERWRRETAAAGQGEAAAAARKRPNGTRRVRLFARVIFIQLLATLFAVLGMQKRQQARTRRRVRSLT